MSRYNCLGKGISGHMAINKKPITMTFVGVVSFIMGGLISLTSFLTLIWFTWFKSQED